MNSSFFFGVATIAYILAMVAYIVYLAFKKSTIGIIGTTATVVGFASQTLAFGLRWAEFYDIGRMGVLRSIPLTNLYESLVFFVWCIVLGYLVIEWKYKTRSFGAFITPIAVITLAFISISGVSTEIQPLVPALQSNWLLAHVTMSFIAYSAFAISCAAALMFLAVTAEDRKSFPYIFWTVTLALFITSFVAMGFDFVTLRISAKSPEAFIQNYLFKAPAANDFRETRKRRLAGGKTLAESGHNINIERVARRARFLGAVEHGEILDGLGSAARKCSTEKGR